VSEPLPASVQKVIDRFRALGREEKMQALVAHARKLEPVPEELRRDDPAAFTVPECATPVEIFPDAHDGLLHFYADVNVRQSPTVAAFLSILFGAINEHPPATTLAIPDDFVRQVMGGIGLAAREAGLDGILARVKRHAATAAAAEHA
jgi:cysteine desulfuration protein SufE